MAAKGYVVLYTNPRGSSTYGQDFGNIIQFAYPGDDYKDLMAGVDESLKKGYIDETRMGVTGGSGGGLLTNWVVDADHAVQGGRSASGASPTGPTSGAPRTSRCSGRRGSASRRSRIRRTSRSARRSLTWPRFRRR